MTKKIDRIKELIGLLNEASKAYYQEDREIMSNAKYDNLYDELVELEKSTGVIMADSPTVQVGYEAVDELPKERHESPMLSLNKTKEVAELQEWLGDQEGLLSWKLDGLTIVLTYREGKLYKAVTRGNGEVGEVITNNAKVFKNIPLTIPFLGEVILRGEAVIKYSDFELINKEIDEASKYKNPRNLCSGTVRQLNNEITAARNVNFFAFALVKAEGVEMDNSRENQMQWMKKMGFETAAYHKVTKENIEDRVKWFANAIQEYDIPSDGLVLLLNDIAYGESLGRTAKFPRNAIAFKWADEMAETKLLEIEWSPSRTGLINPVAIFEPVELEGTTVSRASVHNVSIVRELQLGEGDTIQVYKANMIIPQIEENLTRSDTCKTPEVCPVCGKQTQIITNNEVQYLHCVNSECAAKKIKSFTLLVSRDALNIDGFSEATLEKFIEKGFVKTYKDLFHLDTYENEITQMEGFGKKSFDNLMESVENARNVSLHQVIYGLGIPNIGNVNAKVLCKSYRNNYESIVKADANELAQVEGIGPIAAEHIVEFFASEEKRTQVQELLQELHLQEESQTQEQSLAELTFVITGSTHTFTNRNEMKDYIEERGGKVTGSVSLKTNYLINNDITSNSGKNKKAKELGIEIITEQQLLEMTKKDS